MRIKKAVRIITLIRYNSHAEPLFKTHQILTKGEQLQLQEHKLLYKYRHGNLPVYLFNWNVTSNYNIHGHDNGKATHIIISMTIHDFAKKKCLKYNLPHIILDTPELFRKMFTHSLRGVVYYLKIISYKNIKIYVQYMSVKYTNTL